jgi:hypothetical protein
MIGGVTWQFLVLFNDPFTQHNTRTHDYHPCIEILTGTLGNALRYSHGACLLIQSAAAGRDYSSDGFYMGINISTLQLLKLVDR